jgi:hypothetical protein
VSHENCPTALRLSLASIRPLQMERPDSSSLHDVKSRHADAPVKIRKQSSEAGELNRESILI